MKDQSSLMFNYDCELCGKNTVKSEYKRYPVIFLKDKILVCWTCHEIIKDNGEYSTFKVVKK